MVKVTNPDDYLLDGFRISRTQNKKYDAILRHKETGRFLYVPFGDLRYGHYEDKTDQQFYWHLNHYNKKRRARFKARHYKNAQNKYSSAYFSYHYLW